MQTFLDSRHLAHEKELDRLAIVTLRDNISPREARRQLCPKRFVRSSLNYYR